MLEAQVCKKNTQSIEMVNNSFNVISAQLATKHFVSLGTISKWFLNMHSIKKEMSDFTWQGF